MSSLFTVLVGVVMVACAICAPAMAQVVDQPGGNVQVERSEPLTSYTPRAGGSADAVYSNLGNFRNQSFAAGGATPQLLNTITRMAADDLNLVGTPPYQVNGFRFTVTNLNAVDVSARMLVRFYLPNGSNGGPGWLIAAFTYNPMVFTAGRVSTIKTSTRFVLSSSSIWAGIVFDNANGTSGATAAQLDNLAQGVFSPAELGTSANRYFITQSAGSFAEDNPLGIMSTLPGGIPPADFGWEILAAQDVDLSITVSDGVTTAVPGGSVVYAITAANAGPDTVFGARVSDTFPASLTCSWTCTGSAGNTCAASGTGSINDATVGLAVGGSVTYTATCSVSPGATGTLVNTATILAPGTAVERDPGNNSATDNDAIAVPPPAVTRVTLSPLVPNPTAVGTTTTATVRVDTSPGSPPPTGVVSVLLNSSGQVLCTITLPATTCTYAPAQPGEQEVVASYAGDAIYSSGFSNVVVMSIPPVRPVVTFVSLVPNPVAAGTATAATVTVDKHPLYAPPTGTIRVVETEGGGLLCTIVLPATSCVFTPTVPGAPRLNARYLGDTNYEPDVSNSPVLVVVGITSAAPPGGSVGTAYSHTYTASTTLAYTVTSGALPPGLALAGNGVLNGTPTTAGTFTGVVTGTTGSIGTSQAFSIVIGAILPGAPAIGAATAGNAQASVAFTPPASNGGSPITSYTVTSSPGGFIASGAASPITVSGLTNGAAYTFTVTATNAVGTGPASAASNSVTPGSLPGAPTIVATTPGDRQASISFVPPASDGGSPITGYTATCAAFDTFSAAGAGSPITVTGLRNGTTYGCSVAATNAIGTGPASVAANVTPTAVPGAPTIGVASAGNAQASVAFTAPVSNGGTPITGYTVTSSPGGISASGAASPITVGGLSNGTAYTFTVTATNAVGTGPASAASNIVTPAAVPGAPTIGAATAGNAQASVAFTPPASNGGSPIASYTVTSSPGGISASGAASPVTVGGLANGTAYTFTVTATNAVGTGPASAASNSVTPGGLPGAPTIIATTPGDGQASISFTPPASNGGSPITGYTATCAAFGTFSASGAGSPITVTGLRNGTTYGCSVSATNAVGTGPASSVANVMPVAPATVPGAPTIGAVAPGDGQASVSFTPPASHGGSPITGYTATCGAFSAPGASSPITVTGLTNGTSYPCSVTATNAVGTGPASATVNVTPAAPTAPATVPGAPTIGAAVPGNGQASVSFTPPASNGGSPITGYTATCGAFSASGASSPITVAGLTNGTSYPCSVTATNAVGTGPASAIVNVTPATLPGAPTIGTATPGNAQASVAFAAPASNGGSPITSYTVTSSPGGFSASGAASPITVGGLANGTAYTFTVTATNAVGAGPASAASNSVTPAGLPGAPTIGAATPGDGKASVSFTPPAANGGSPITGYTATCTAFGAFSASGAGSPIVVTGLRNGTAYSCTVAATNAIGTGPASASVSVTPVAPATVPGAPTIGTAVPGDSQASVSFTPPASNGGSPITGYTATCGTLSASGAASPITVTGLTNGTTYPCSVTATNAIGTGPASASASVTPAKAAAVPGAPTIGAAIAGNGQASVSFTPPAADGGSPITGYTATSSPGGISASGAASPITVGGLTNGTAYTFTVTATNAVGTGPASAASNSVTPAGLPGAPTIGAATPGDGQASVSFTPPAANGGSAITGYTARCTAFGAFSASGAASPIIVTGLKNGTAYSCSVTATNAIGTGSASESVGVTPASVPGAPRLRSALPGNGLAVVAFAPPLPGSGLPITGYTATCGAFSASGAGSPLIVTGLTNGTAYPCSVTAANTLGTGPASATMSVTPVALTTYSGSSATGTGTITASFTGGGGTCAFAAPQFIAAPPGEEPIPPTVPDGAVTFPHGLFDFSARRCTAGATLTFTITYPVALIQGMQYWKYGPTADNPAPHWYTLPATISGNTATFTITDGGLGDDDLLANGSIVDQGGPGSPPASVAIAIPVSSPLTSLLLALLLAVGGWFVGFRRRT